MLHGSCLLECSTDGAAAAPTSCLSWPYAPGGPSAPAGAVDSLSHTTSSRNRSSTLPPHAPRRLPPGADTQCLQAQDAVRYCTAGAGGAGGVQQGLPAAGTPGAPGEGRDCCLSFGLSFLPHCMLSMYDFIGPATEAWGCEVRGSNLHVQRSPKRPIAGTERVRSVHCERTMHLCPPTWALTVDQGSLTPVPSAPWHACRSSPRPSPWRCSR